MSKFGSQNVKVWETKCQSLVVKMSKFFKILLQKILTLNVKYVNIILSLRKTKTGNEFL